jgi:hypothetical protein
MLYHFCIASSGRAYANNLINDYEKLFGENGDLTLHTREFAGIRREKGGTRLSPRHSFRVAREASHGAGQQ